jgi:hypothetical protein
MSQAANRSTRTGRSRDPGPSPAGSISTMDQFAQMAQKAMVLARKIDLEARLARFDINDTTRANMLFISPLLVENMDRVIISFYAYLNRFPETKALLKGRDIDILRSRQKFHWERVLRCEFDLDYAFRCMMIGIVHLRAKVSPQIYMSGYSFFATELLTVISKSHQGMNFDAAASAVNKLIMFDMSVVLDAYWLNAVMRKI